MHSLPSIESVEPIIDQGFQLSSTFMFLGLKVTNTIWRVDDTMASVGLA